MTQEGLIEMLDSIADRGNFSKWGGNIEGISSNILLNFMINKGAFI